MTEESSLRILKEEYTRYRDKYNLPGFHELNQIFDIEDVEYETDFLLRKIRRVILDRVVGYLRFIEIMLNPSNAPMFFFKLVGKLEKEDKEALTELYEKLGKFELKAIKIDLDYLEEKEADLIKELYNVFHEEIRGILLKTVMKLENGKEGKQASGDECYFG
jgi:hypothetical protein